MVKEVGERSQDEVQSLEELDENVLLCKARSVHQMSIIRIEEKTWGDEVDWRCDVCGCERYDSYDPHGSVLTRWYRPAVRSKVVGERMYAGDFRVEMFRRLKAGGMAIARSGGRKGLRVVNGG